MPISRTASSTRSGEAARSTPSASIRSALPQRLETERLPCLATVTPQPATTKAVTVEMLKVPAPSPPVPQVSTTRPPPAWMRAALRRMALAAPASSSNVSPLVASAAMKAPISVSERVPEKISAISSEVSSSVRFRRWTILRKPSRNMSRLSLVSVLSVVTHAGEALRLDRRGWKAAPTAG